MVPGACCAPHAHLVVLLLIKVACKPEGACKRVAGRRSKCCVMAGIAGVARAVRQHASAAEEVLHCPSRLGGCCGRLQPKFALRPKLQPPDVTFVALWRPWVHHRRCAASWCAHQRGIPTCVRRVLQGWVSMGLVQSSQWWRVRRRARTKLLRSTTPHRQEAFFRCLRGCNHSPKSYCCCVDACGPKIPSSPPQHSGSGVAPAGRQTTQRERSALPAAAACGWSAQQRCHCNGACRLAQTVTRQRRRHTFT